MSHESVHVVPLGMSLVHDGAYVPPMGAAGAEAHGFGSQLPASCHSDVPAPVPVHVTGSVPPERV
jgi:hypothetical protein